jgi:putative Holliday junction resolvase
LEDNIRHILSVDYGTKRIGLALSDPLMIFSYTYKTILNDNNLWNNLDAIIKDKQIIKIILGVPYQENGQLSSNAPGIMKFKQELSLRYKIEIIEWDERYTSERARENILQTVPGKKKRKDKGLVDQNSAQIMLQEYLDSLK